MRFDSGDVVATMPAPGPKRILKGSPQQEAFWDELVRGSDHLLLEARAGTGKSSSAREGMHRIKDAFGSVSIRYTCFNKAIADEFRLGCPDGVDVGTMHSFGFRALSSAFGCQVDQQKTYTLMDSMGNAPEKRYLRSSISKLVSAVKSQSPDMPVNWRTIDTLATFLGIECWRQEDLVYRWVEKLIPASDEMTGVVDYDDMLRLPAIHGVSFPAVDYLFIDECQDLSPVQHALAEGLSGSGRTVIIGDPFQAVYAFRGADSESIPKLRDRLGAKAMPLTVTWRCPRSHVELARELVPDFEAAPEAPEGTIERGNLDLIEAAGPGDMVLCRANAPIVSACLRAVADRRRAFVRGRAIGDQLLAVVRKLNDPPTVPAMVREISRWRAQEIARLEAKDGTESLIEAVEDRAMCLEAIAGSCASPAEVPGVIGQLFADGDANGRITFSSVHRAKGSEARNVTYIQVPYSEKRDRIDPPKQWEINQRRNLRYVAVTRSSDKLTLVSY